MLRGECCGALVMEFICHDQFCLPYSNRIITGLNLSITIGTSLNKSNNRSSVCSSSQKNMHAEQPTTSASNQVLYNTNEEENTGAMQCQSYKVSKVQIKKTKSKLSRTGIEPVTDGFLGKSATTVHRSTN